MLTKEDLIATENRIKQLWDDGEINSLTHLCGGNEDDLIEIFKSIKRDDWVFSSHRAHYQALLHGMPPDNLIEEVKRGRSMFLYMPKFITSAIVAGNPCIAAGVALSIQRRKGSEHVWCFIGDGAVDEAHTFEAIRYIHAKKLPCTIVIEDNSMSVGVTKAQRDSAEDWPKWPDCVIHYKYTLPYPHAGSGSRPKLKSTEPPKQ